MKNITSFISRQLLSIAIIGLLLPSFALYSQDKKQTPAANTLVYNYPVNKPLSYVQTTKVVQSMDINGQSMQTNVNSVFGATITGLGSSDPDAKIEVRIDSMSQSIDSPAGVTGGSVDAIKGKTFNIKVSVTGKITDSNEAANVKFDVNGTQADALSAIDNFFPVLPAGQLTPGYKWTSSDSINQKTPAVTTLGIVTTEGTFEGFETYRGFNCAKLTSVLSGTRVMKTQSQGMDIKISGPYTGTITVYFAPAEGYFIKQEVTSKMNGTIDITTPDAMSFPIVMETTMTKELK
jgi:hypothetical protein